MPDVIREMNEIRIRIVYRVGSDIFVQEYLVAQQEVVKYQDSYEQQNQCNQKRNEKTSKGKKDTNGRSRVRPAWRIANVLSAHLEQKKKNPSRILAFCSSRYQGYAKWKRKLVQQAAFECHGSREKVIGETRGSSRRREIASSL